MRMDTTELELTKILLGPLLTAGFAWAVGNRISAAWTHRQKHREYSLAVTAEFYQVYGEFFAIWKLANYSFRHSRPEITPEFILGLIQRAAAMEARIEAMLLRAASELQLTLGEIRTLGLYRQAVQLLRQSIILRRQLDFFGTGQAKYELYKELSVAVGDLVASLGARDKPDASQAKAQMTEITSSKWEVEWHRIFREADRDASDAMEAA
jgi:hypothetical protein